MPLLMRNMTRLRGFTLVEVLIVIVVISILATIGVVSYNSVQRRGSAAVTERTVADALKSLQLYYVFNKAYASNVADTEYVPSPDVAVTLFTNSSHDPVYSGLTPDQNAQLFLNACNGAMPIVEGGVTYNTACIYNGNNEHIKGTVSSNVVINGPTIEQSEFVLKCGVACDQAQSDIISKFIAQGGKFPVIVPKKGSTLPAPTSMVTGPATRFCVQGISGRYDDIAYYATEKTDGVRKGKCPSDPELIYP